MVGLGRSTADRCGPGRGGASRDLPVGCRRDRGGNRTQRPHGFGADIATEIAALTGRPFVTAPNRFEAQGGLDGITLDRAKITEYLDRSLMLVTALSPAIGYDKASAIAHDADRTGATLRDAAIKSGYISAEEFDRIVNPAAMIGPF